MTPAQSFAPGVVNRIVESLPAAELEQVYARARRVELRFHATIQEARDPIEYVYFPTSGLVSLLTVLNDGEAVEAATVGREGVVGASVQFEPGTSPLRAVVQAPGTALRVPAGPFRELLTSCPDLRRQVDACHEALFTTVAQCVACNLLHSVANRCARWLLVVHDQVGTDDFPMTHEFLAQMLGVRRPSVTEAARHLLQNGAIDYRHGQVTVLNRATLEAAACECYAVIRAAQGLGAPRSLDGSREGITPPVGG